MVDHFSAYIYQKRGFYYFSRRVPKQLQHCHSKQRIVLALNTKSATDLIENIFLRFLGRLPNQKEQTSALELINPGFENRVSMNDESFKPKQNEKLPLITWFNHLSPEATTVQMKVEKQVRQGPPVDPRINPDWRERYEDLIWSLINHREFVWLN